MCKNRKKKCNKKSNNNKQEVKLEIDYDKLAEAIVKSNRMIEQDEKHQEDKARQDVIQQRKKYLKEKDFSHIKNPIWRGIRTFLNRIRVIKRLLFIPKIEITKFSAIDGLICLFTTVMLYIFRIVLYVISAALLLSILWGNNALVAISFAFLTFVFAQLFRIAQYEVDRIKNRDYLLALFVGILTAISIVISLITLLPDSDIIDIKQLLIEIKDLIQK